MKPIVVGVAGTAKNTGKTTTMLALMNEIKKDNSQKLALTSIGYDGEEVDNITGLPKPRVFVWEGMLAAVAERCIEASTADLEVLYKTDIRTSLGKIIIARVMSEGMLLLAGPNKAKELAAILELLAEQGANLIIIDGALNRIAPMIETDGLIISTGASRSTDNKQLVEEIAMMSELFRLPVLTLPSDARIFANILGTDQAQVLINEMQRCSTVMIKGIMSHRSLEYLLQNSHKIQGKRLIFSDPIKMILSSDIQRNSKIYASLINKGLILGVLKEVRLLAVTVNPYYPRYCPANGDYEAAYVDHTELYNAVKEASQVPVYDVVQEGAEKLLHHIIDNN